MCGIVGFWGEGNIQQMLDVIAHRGPDGQNSVRSGPISIGAVSLKIVDPEGPDQPFWNEDRTVCAVLNGEIYNYIELKQELAHHHFQTETDTEVIVHAYEEWGIDCLDKFIGMFAFAIWDGKQLIIARDRMGQKPLYYYAENDDFLFGSEIKSLLTHVPAEPNLIENFHVFESPLHEETLFKDIHSIPPASYLTYDGNNLNISTYWSIDPDRRTSLNEDECIETLRELLADAVRLRMRSNVPVGIFLSGGLDSSLIAYLGKPHFAYSCRYNVDGIFDEIKYAELTARDIGAEHFIIEPTWQDYQDQLRELVWHLDQPVATAAALSCFMLARQAKNDVKVILNGEGSDEILNGYTRHLLMKIEEELGKQPELARYHSLARLFWNPNMFGDPASRYYELSRRGQADTNKPFQRVKDIFDHHRHLLNKISATDIEVTLPSLLMMADRVCSAFGVENRSPFLDHRIVEFVFSLPPEMRIRDYETKYLLRRVARGIVPDAIIDRKEKQGLVTPLGNWMANEMKPWCDPLLASLSNRNLKLRAGPERGKYDRQNYLRVCLELWFQLYFDDRLRSTSRGA